MVQGASARRSRKTIRIPTPDNLVNVALYYLSRFAASEASLRRALENRVRRAALAHPDFAADEAARGALQQVIAGIVAKHKASGVLNDAAFAEMKVRSLRRAGRSARRITQQLQHKGVAAATIATALLPEDDGDAEGDELQAARAFARRRGLGPYRKKAADADQLRKDIASFARAGFSYDISRQILGASALELDDQD